MNIDEIIIFVTIGWVLGMTVGIIFMYIAAKSAFKRFFDDIVKEGKEGKL